MSNTAVASLLNSRIMLSQEQNVEHYQRCRHMRNNLLKPSAQLCCSHHTQRIVLVILYKASNMLLVTRVVCM